tara:strand:+ start:222 stop:830 length:609 start_codon:yes stop_codon:yes gene_type:complete
MFTKEIYYYFQKALPSRLCNDIIKHGNELTKIKGETGIEQIRKNVVRKLTNKEKAEPRKMRKSTIAWLDDPWIYKEIQPYVQIANKQAGWDFDLQTVEKIQFTEYRPGQFYNYHQDNFHNKGLARKISMTVNLSKDSDYEGGDLYFKTIDRKNHDVIEITNKEFRHQGTLCVFPSFEVHKVTPLTKGVRYSLVLWTLGEKFK